MLSRSVRSNQVAEPSGTKARVSPRKPRLPRVVSRIAGRIRIAFCKWHFLRKSAQSSPRVEEPSTLEADKARIYLSGTELDSPDLNQSDPCNLIVGADGFGSGKIVSRLFIGPNRLSAFCLAAKSFTPDSEHFRTLTPVQPLKEFCTGAAKRHCPLFALRCAWD